jgi:hypothetical protein
VKKLDKRCESERYEGNLKKKGWLSALACIVLAKSVDVFGSSNCPCLEMV